MVNFDPTALHKQRQNSIAMIACLNYRIQIKGTCGPCVKAKDDQSECDPTIIASSKRKGREKKHLKKKKARDDLIFAHLINYHLWRPIMDSASIVSCFSIRSCVQSRSSPLSFLSLSLPAPATTFHRRGLPSPLLCRHNAKKLHYAQCRQLRRH